MLNFSITTVSLGGQRRNKIVSVAPQTRFKDVLNQARTQGLKFGYGVLSINGTPIPPKNVSMVLDGRVTKNAVVLFEERRRPTTSSGTDTNIFDLDSLQ